MPFFFFSCGLFKVIGGGGFVSINSGRSSISIVFIIGDFNDDDGATFVFLVDNGDVMLYLLNPDDGFIDTGDFNADGKVGKVPT